MAPGIYFRCYAVAFAMLSEAILKKIEQARRTGAAPAAGQPSRAVPEYRNIGELLFKQARQYDTKPYLIFYDLAGARSEFSYKDFFTLVGKCANVLHRHGVRRGDRVATISHNHSDTVIQYFAAWLMGACIVPVSLSEDDHRIRFILENSRAKLAFLRKDYEERISPIVKSLASDLRVISCSKRFEDELRNASAMFSSEEAVTIEDEALIVYTSGTTGNPKGVVLTQHNLLADARGITDWHAMTNRQRMMCVLPIHHVNGTIVTLVTPMYFGGTVVLNQKFQSEHFFERIAKERVNVVSVVPTLLAFLIEYYKDRKMASGDSPLATRHSAFATLRHLICGAGPLTVELGAQFEEIGRA